MRKILPYAGLLLLITSHNDGRAAIKLSPEVRQQTIDSPMTSITLSHIQPFLKQHLIIGNEISINNTHIIGFAEDHLYASTGDHLYVNELADIAIQKYKIIRPGFIYFDPASKEKLGQLVLVIGEAQLRQTGQPAMLKVTRAHQEITVGDYIIADTQTNAQQDFDVEPQTPSEHIEGVIIDIFGGITQISSHQTVVINKGKHDGIATGHLLQIVKRGNIINTPSNRKEKMTLAHRSVGEMIVFRAFDRMSFALVLNALEPIRKFYGVTNL